MFDAELARHILSVNAERYPRPFIVNKVFGDVAGTNRFTSAGSAWSWRRKAMQPSFQRAPMERLTPAIETFLSAEIDRLPSGRLADAQAWFASLTVAVASVALFNRELSAVERTQLDG